MPKKIGDELRARALQLVNDHQDEYSSLTAAAVVLGKQLGVGKECRRVIQSQVHGVQRTRATTSGWPTGGGRGQGRRCERATRMAVELRRDPDTRQGAIPRVAEQLGVHPETLLNWVRQAEVDGGVHLGITTSEALRVADLKLEVCEPRRASRILTTASAFFAAELDCPTAR